MRFLMSQTLSLSRTHKHTHTPGKKKVLKSFTLYARNCSPSTHVGIFSRDKTIVFSFFLTSPENIKRNQGTDVMVVPAPSKVKDRRMM